MRIRASHDRLWAIVDDISLIPQYHAEVGKVDLLSGQSTRAMGVKYQCTILEGRKGSFVEEVVDYVPGERFSTAFPEDTWGISKMLRDFVVDSILGAAGGFRDGCGPRSLLRAHWVEDASVERPPSAASHGTQGMRTLEGVKRLAEAT